MAMTPAHRDMLSQQAFDLVHELNQQCHGNLNDALFVGAAALRELLVHASPDARPVYLKAIGAMLAQPVEEEEARH